ncbi:MULTISPECIES: Pr6Pr family membrane protein [unclassified Microbacterium]|uniref:Pr6Pr family membrane protein n=1 Tax=unclassified Microbacterium TaxID=2609290 RepID=UPI000B2D4A35|nr:MULTISPECIES: Pr6Pr family membrane protein [unclassified Microbacterium]
MLRTPTGAHLWAALRLAMAALLLATILTQLVTSIDNAVANDWHLPTVIANFFSYFTILSNALSVIVLTWAAVWFWTRGRGLTTAGAPRREPLPLALALASVTTYMIVTGIVYNVLLRGFPLPGAQWTNEILHVIGPLFLLLDLLVAPHVRSVRWRAIWVVLAFPIVWVVYTMVRGPFTTSQVTGTTPWYPYPFLDPNSAMTGGIGGVIAYIVAIAVGIALVAAGVIWVRRRRGARHAASLER